MRQEIQQQCTQLAWLSWCHTQRIFGAVPSFLGRTISHAEAPPIFSNTFRIVLQDLLPIALTQAVYSYLVTSKNETEDSSLTDLAYFYVVGFVAMTVVRRQYLRLFAHTSILQLGYSDAFKHAQQFRKLPQENICKSCTTARLIKGEIRTLLVYIVQLFMLWMMEWIPWVGVTVATVLRALLSAQVIVEYRLANHPVPEERLCDRHRAEYFLQYPGLLAAIGFWHYMTTQIVASAFTAIPGVTRSDMHRYVNAVTLLYFIALTNHMHFPPAVAKATYSAYEPLSVVRAIVGCIVDLLIPGLIRWLDHMASVAKNNPEYQMACQQRIIKIKNFYKHRRTQQLLSIVLPRMYRDLELLANDSILKLYWPATLRKVVEQCNAILRARKYILLGSTIAETYELYFLPIQNSALAAGFFLNVLSPVVAVFQQMTRLNVSRLIKAINAIGGFGSVQTGAVEATSFVKKRSKSVLDFSALLSGTPKGAVIILIALLRNEDFVAYLQRKLNGWETLLNSRQTKKADDCQWPLCVSVEPVRASNLSDWEEVAANADWDYATEDGKETSNPMFPPAPQTEPSFSLTYSRR
ncbi:MAG: hypothetical protein A3I77_03430 [Gammaproteobacteria bacterium RIFCSPLOWO2_02_FULL_42_14]|nr:MAG: hypothetical protein A3B71_01410 [Gammaproteobacteria bacterium RIFCSPHIGHO2_02_FULL_42_43]OGT28980.1 MAG: hypothetical protein A2624_05890 [Gammaproteobacteria bacterium RIFCSPHIGHO2_01_FULL_42_8]OGT51724.1 MAG: hypothetical protein A3E54_03625 [Gammaproteobacteria bacterium RIFCSPHIGHO2_12_FULL_41_25]OGT61621.1 MAG: hypothetical protein A3I77_03430 [Gammaproteobacteria bacterium RIFCSPLOWO2_02_FULL_42_14]OGT86245.1 MAG: hypothetical protein A3G86_06280 [Gammaproteobacteria bacterium R